MKKNTAELKNSKIIEIRKEKKHSEKYGTFTFFV
jgi:hypothetical protein